MGWIEKLNTTYENCRSEIGKMHLNDKGELKYVLMPIAHTSQNSQIEITLDIKGDFLRAIVVPKNDKQTILPATEGSAGRSGSKLAPLSLGDKLQYIAGDYEKYGGKKKSGFKKYISRLERWVTSDFAQKEILSVFNYCKKESVIADLLDAKILFYDLETSFFPSKWGGETNEKPLIFTVLQGDQLDSLVRFRVESPDDLEFDLWKNRKIYDSWTEYYLANKILEDNNDIDDEKKKLPNDKKVFCFVDGKFTNFAGNHPAKIRNAGDGAKLISSNDSSGFTYRGRFLNDEQACSIGYEVSQKAHNALRWLIVRQGYRDGDLAIIAWSPNDKPVPSPFKDSDSLNNDELWDIEDSVEEKEYEVVDTAEQVGNNLSKKIRGYSVKLGNVEQIAVMAINSATPGRLSVSMYRELSASDFLKRLEAWHAGCAWLQKYSKDKVFYGAPAPRDIVYAAYGENVDDKLKQATIERLLPCIIDLTPIPRDIVFSVVRQCTNRIVQDNWRWEKTLGIACAVFRYYKKEKGYKMALEENRTTRDYLYGRLLAIADSIEGFALSQAEKGRPTNAARMMQRFADHPCSTWRTLELSLRPYKARLGAKVAKYEKAIDSIMNSFNAEDFSNDSSLSGEFLLGYHTQRSELMKTNNKNQIEEN